MNPHVKIQFEINSQRLNALPPFVALVNPHVKIQFEINSQPYQWKIKSQNTCESSRKNTI